MIQLLTVPGFDGHIWCLRTDAACDGTAEVGDGLWYLAGSGAGWDEVFASYLDATDQEARGTRQTTKGGLG